MDEPSGNKRPDREAGRYTHRQILRDDPDVKRYYPYSNFAASVIGFTGSDDVGLSGLELEYNSTLTGTRQNNHGAERGSQLQQYSH
jgi:cell division protein FtsI/penicillin-binding protein 2